MLSAAMLQKITVAACHGVQGMVDIRFVSWLASNLGLYFL